MQQTPSLFILVAEDDPQARLSLDVTLRRAGHRTLLMESADALLEAVDQMSNAEITQINLLLTDINMPGTKGGQLIRELDSRGLHLPVVVITAYGSETLVEEFSERGAVSFLRKPFLPKALIKSVSMTNELFQLAQHM